MSYLNDQNVSLIFMLQMLHVSCYKYQHHLFRCIVYKWLCFCQFSQKQQTPWRRSGSLLLTWRQRVAAFWRLCRERVSNICYFPSVFIYKKDTLSASHHNCSNVTDCKAGDVSQVGAEQVDGKMRDTKDRQVPHCAVSMMKDVDHFIYVTFFYSYFQSSTNATRLLCCSDPPGHLEEKVSQLEAMLKKLQDDLQKVL